MHHRIQKDFEKKADKIKQGRNTFSTEQYLVKFSKVFSLFEYGFEDGT